MSAGYRDIMTLLTKCLSTIPDPIQTYGFPINKNFGEGAKSDCRDSPSIGSVIASLDWLHLLNKPKSEQITVDKKVTWRERQVLIGSAEDTCGNGRFWLAERQLSALDCLVNAFIHIGRLYRAVNWITFYHFQAIPDGSIVQSCSLTTQ